MQYTRDTLRVYLGNGNGSFQAPKTINLSGCSNECGLLGVGKINRDDKLDLIVGEGINSSTGSVTVLLGNGDGTFGNAKTTRSSHVGQHQYHRAG